MEDDTKVQAEIIHMDHMDLVGDYSNVHVRVGLKTEPNVREGVSIQFAKEELGILLKVLEGQWLSSHPMPATMQLLAFLRAALAWSQANPGQVLP